MKKSGWAAGAVVLFLLYYFASPWNYKELEKLSIVTGLALDKGEAAAFRMTFEVMDEGERRSVFFTEGDSLGACVENGALVVQSPLYLPHAKVLLVSEAFARSSMRDMLDFVTERDDLRLSLLLVVVREGLAGDVFQGAGEDNMSFRIAEYLGGKNPVAPEGGRPFYTFYSPYVAGERCFLPMLAIEGEHIAYKGVTHWN